MKKVDTKIIYNAKDAAPLPEELFAAVKNGELAVIPTETVYGLAANGLDENAVANIFAAKGRPSDNPLILHISDIAMWETLVTNIPNNARRLAEKFWPGPLTIILPKSEIVPLKSSGGLSTVAVRMPMHPIAQKIIKATSLPLAAPSANISGKPSPTKLEHCISDMMGKVSYIVDGGDCALGVESTVIDMSGETAVILRPGSISPEQIAEVIGEVIVDEAVLSPLSNGDAPLSPGMKYMHYSPNAQVYIVKGSLEAFSSYLKDVSAEGSYAMVFDGEEEAVPLPSVSYGGKENYSSQANRLFASLRKLDKPEIKYIYVRSPAKDGIGLAVYNRLIRAAGFNIINLEV